MTNQQASVLSGAILVAGGFHGMCVLNAPHSGPTLGDLIVLFGAAMIMGGIASVAVNRKS